MIHFDFETRSEIDLRKVGAFVYAEHPSTEALCMGYRIDDGEVEMWRMNDAPPQKLFDLLEQGALFVAHNIEFDANIWEHTCGWPHIPLEQRRDTAAMVAAMALPRSLEKSIEHLKLPFPKDMEGNKLMMKMTKPRRPSKTNPAKYWFTDDMYNRLVAYCRQDVRAESALEKKVRPLSAAEEEVFKITNTMNNRGVYVDVAACHKMLELLEEGKQRALNKVEQFGLPRDALTRVALLKQWLSEQGIETDSLAKAKVSELLAGDLPDNVRGVLELRQEIGKTSTAKYESFINRTSSDGRLRGTLLYHGATTGRWSGRGVQLQNMPRGSVKDTDQAIEAVMAGDAEFVEMLYDTSIFDVASSCLRGMLRAQPGYKLAICDYSAIEARTLAWLAGQDDVIEIFKGHGKIYEHAAAGIYNKKIDEVTKDERFIGKVAVLALGYQGAKGAFLSMANAYGVDIEDDRAMGIVDGWRKSNTNIVKYWHAVEKSAKEAVSRGGRPITLGNLKFQYKNNFLRIALPSGRVLSYPSAKLTQGKLQYETTVVGDHWATTDTYGGKLVENITQAVARDLLAHAWVNCEKAGLPIVISVHDELVAEVPEDADGLGQLEEIMTQLPDWAAGLPLAAEGFESVRYKK